MPNLMKKVSQTINGIRGCADNNGEKRYKQNIRESTRKQGGDTNED